MATATVVLIITLEHDHGLQHLRRHGAVVAVIGLDEASATMVERFGTHHRPNAEAKPVH